MNSPVAVKAQCQRCASQFITQYRLIGAIESCSHCLRETTLSITPGADTLDTRYELTYLDFLQVVQHESARDLLKRWAMDFDQRIAVPEESNSATNALLARHLAIQSNAKQQYEIYQFAMSLWR